MTAPRKLRVSGDAREAVLTRLVARHEYFAEQEQLLIALGWYTESQGAGQYAVWVQRAHKAERDDPEPA